MNFCERYSLEKKKWEQVANLNHKRCAMVCLVWNDWIFVAGGFDGTSEIDAIERYNEETNTWEVLGLNLVVPVESMTSHILSEHELLIIGGRLQNNSQTDKIWKYTIIPESMDASCGEEVGTLKCSHSLHATM